MSEDQRDSAARSPRRLTDPAVLLEKQSRLLDRLARHRDGQQPQDVKGRLVSQWKQTLALSSAATRKLVTDPPRLPAPAAAPADRRTPPTPPNPLRNPGRTVVSRVRREPETKTAPAVETVPTAMPTPTPTPEPEPEPEPEPAPAAEPTPAPAPAAELAPAPALECRVKPPRGPVRSRWIPTAPSLTQRLTEVALQTAGTVLVALALKLSHAAREVQASTWRGSRRSWVG
jgi:outer membrane biosynthesis protein TonB